MPDPALAVSGKSGLVVDERVEYRVVGVSGFALAYRATREEAFASMALYQPGTRVESRTVVTETGPWTTEPH
jgi:hypothetical protein